ncbi:MAG: OmpA family protein [Planctomycetota bacterium]
MTKKNLLIAAGLSALSLGLVGCVPQEKYNALRIEKEALEAQINEAQSDQLAARREADLLRSQVGQLSGGNESVAALIAGKDRQIDQLRTENTDLLAAYEAALQEGAPALPAPVINDLNRFADANPGLVEFDERTGTIRFSSDLTFGSGSAVLNPSAGEAISQFASILQNDTIAEYELLIAGHTDNVPVSNPATRQKHPDNWYLSSHRAISVAEALRRNGVAKERFAVAGYADQRPVADNGTTAGKAANRRVEVLILPTKAPTGTPAGQPRMAAEEVVPVETDGGLEPLK